MYSVRHIDPKHRVQVVGLETNVLRPYRFNVKRKTVSTVRINQLYTKCNHGVLLR